MSVQTDRHGISTLIGTPKEIQTHLQGSAATRVVAVELPSAGDAEIIADNLSKFVSAMSESIATPMYPDVVGNMVDLLVPRKPPTAHALKEAAMLARAKKAVLENGDWVTAAELAKLAELKTVNPSSQPNKWKRNQQIFAIAHNGVDYYPTYGLDPLAGYRPLKAMARVIELLSPYRDSWGMAYWFASDNSMLNGKRPQDLLQSEPDRVIEAAFDEIDQIAHG